ncbi:hypothetical protein HZB93_02070 [Candidatus Falkowbacteria bacterium]|nr:hypothetical protein [Candidatus Falkowbacteria bacterium]
MDSTAKKIAVGLALLGSLVGGAFVWNEGTRPEPLTFEEQQTLHKIWNYEIEKAGGTITLTGVNEDNLIVKLNEKFTDPSKVETKDVKLPDEETSTATEYELLKAGLFKRAEQRTTLEEILQ